MKRKLTLLASLCLLLALGGCANLKTATKSSSSLSSFLGLSELPDWYISSRYSYLDSNWIENDFGMPIHYRDLGEGDIVVLVHGEMDSLHSWDAWIEKLSTNFRVIAIDLPGSGLSGATHCVENVKQICASNLSMEYLQHTFKYFIEDLGLRDINLVGSSLGGFLAADYAIKHPGNVQKLVLISPSGFQQATPGSLNLITNTGFLSQYVQPSMLITNVIRDFFVEKPIKPTELKRILHLSQGQGMHASNVIQLSIVEEFMKHGTTTNFSALETETLVLWGKKDQWSSPELADLWEQTLPNSTLVTYPDHGHAIMLEQPEITVADVSAYFLGDPMPSIEGLGIEGSFTIEEAASELNKESLFRQSDPDEFEVMEDSP